MKKMEASCFILLVACIGIVIGILIIEKYQPQRGWDFFGAYKHPVVDYTIEREEREL